MDHGIYIGIDAVEIDRFTHFHSYTDYKLRRVFTSQEIHDATKNGALCPSRLATRFAIKEATFKALSQIGTHIPFLTLCRRAWIMGRPPRLYLLDHPEFYTSISISHTHTTAVATVLILTKQ